VHAEWLESDHDPDEKPWYPWNRPPTNEELWQQGGKDTLAPMALLKASEHSWILAKQSAVIGRAECVLCIRIRSRNARRARMKPSLWLSPTRSYKNFPSTNQPTNRPNRDSGGAEREAQASTNLCENSLKNAVACVAGPMRDYNAEQIKELTAKSRKKRRGGDDDDDDEMPDDEDAIDDAGDEF
jgi:hypothetical protein